MQQLGPSRFKTQAKTDWCHVCGERRQIRFVEVWHPRDAEHERNPGKHAQYVRICRTCIESLAEAMSVEVEAQVTDSDSEFDVDQVHIQRRRNR